MSRIAGVLTTAILSVGFLFVAPYARCANTMNARAAGMAGTSVAASVGLDAVGINPANLAFRDDALVTMTILPLGGYIESDFLTFDSVLKYFGGRTELTTLPEVDKQLLVNSFPGSFGKSSAQAGLRFFGITVRTSDSFTLGLTLDYGLVGAITLPQEYARLLLYGNVPGSSFDVRGLDAEAYWSRTYALSAGWMMPDVSVVDWWALGGALKLVQGYGYYGVDQFTASLRTDQNRILSGRTSWSARWVAVNGVNQPLGELFQNPAGYGFGFDIGMSGGWGDYVTVAASITDIGSIQWTGEVEVSKFDSLTSTNDPGVFRSIHAVTGIEGAERRPGEPFVSRLAGVMRFGVACRIDNIGGSSDFPGELLVAAEYSRSVNASALLVRSPRFSLGIEYKPVHWLPLRTGFSYGGSHNVRLAFGIGISSRHFDLDLATEDILWLINGRFSSYGSLGFAMRWKIPK